VSLVTSEAELLRVLRTSLRDAHLDRLLGQLQARVNLGTRTLLGSLASAVAYGVVRGLDAPADTVDETVDTLLTALDVADLVVLEPGPEGLTVRRRTCCLAFTLPEPKLCSGCCIESMPGR
jgi:ferric iron reductase protein FhuF